MDNNFQDTKECPMCAENVKAKAKICRFCRFEFDQLLKESHLAKGTLDEETLDEPIEEQALDEETLDEPIEEQALDEETLDEPIEDQALDDKGWEAYDSFLSNDSNSEASKFEVRYDVWVTGKYNEKICNEIIKITKWDAWVAGKFLLELENDGNSKKLIEEVDLNNAERIKNSLEQLGAIVTIKSIT